MITVEDFNSVFKEYGSSSIFHCIDTSLISIDSDFSDVTYDFSIVDRETTSVDEYTFQFKIINDIWTGGYYFTDINDEYLDISATWDSNNKILTVVTSEPAVKLYLYLSNLAFTSNEWGFNLEQLVWRPIDLTNRNINTQFVASTNSRIHIESLKDEELDGKVGYVTNLSSNLNYLNINTDKIGRYFNYVNNYSQNRTVRFVYKNNSYYLQLNYVKSMGNFCFVDDSLVLGKINKITSLSNYFLKTGILTYLNKSVVVDVTGDIEDSSKAYFDIDLRDVFNIDKLKVKMHLNSVDGDYEWDYEHIYPCSIYQVGTLSDFVGECGEEGTTVFKLGADLTLDEDITVTHDLTVLGEEYSIDLNGHSIIVLDGVKLAIEDCSLLNGDNAIVQKVNSELELTNVSFTNCMSSEYSNLGSCIFCDIDLNSLDNEDDFKTILTGCEFYDNQNAILHGGNLIVDGCKLHNTDLNYIDKHNVAFLYQTDGNATIMNSIFDIDYTDMSLCENEESIGFAQCLIQCGTTAMINNNSYTSLKEEGLQITSNVSHVFAKYYYPTLGECVFTSPILDKEDKALCYCLTGLNKIFKQNVQITKASEQSENTYRKIEW